MKDKNLQKIIELRHELHKIAELSEKEYKTKEFLMSFIRDNTRLKVIDKGKWFYAKYSGDNKGKTIAFRADFDAVSIDESIDLSYASLTPGVSHKCGHDGHAAVLAGFAMEVDDKGTDEEIYFIFQHAEEIGTGAKEASLLISEKNIDEMYAFHNYPGIPLGHIGIKEGTVCFASMGIIIKYHGVSSHASEPEKGKNPAYAIANIINMLSGLTGDEKNEGLVLATIIEVSVGEEAFGVSAHEGRLLLTIRAEKEKDLDRLKNNIGKLAAAEGDKYCLDMEIEYSDIFPETRNDCEIVSKIKSIANEKSYVIHEMEALRTSEDYGYFLEKTKGAMMWIGAGENHAPLHSKEYDFNDELIEGVVDLFCLIAGVGNE